MKISTVGERKAFNEAIDMAIANACSGGDAYEFDRIAYIESLKRLKYKLDEATIVKFIIYLSYYPSSDPASYKAVGAVNMLTTTRDAHLRCHDAVVRFLVYNPQYSREDLYAIPEIPNQ